MTNKTVRSRAPLRLGLAGGGTDVSPYSELYGGYVLNAAIDMYAYCTISANESGDVVFHAPDLGETWRSRNITQGSSHDNVRPFVVLNSTPDRLPNLLWMNNERYVHYTDYRTSIRMNLPSNR